MTTTQTDRKAEAQTYFPAGAVIETNARPATYFLITGHRVTGTGNITVYTTVLTVAKNFREGTVTVEQTPVEATFLAGKLKGYEVRIHKTYPDLDAFTAAVTEDLTNSKDMTERFEARREYQARLNAQLAEDFYSLYEGTVIDLTSTHTTPEYSYDDDQTDDIVVNFRYPTLKGKGIAIITAIIHPKTSAAREYEASIEIAAILTSQTREFRTRRFTTSITAPYLTVEGAMGQLINWLETDSYLYH